MQVCGDASFTPMASPSRKKLPYHNTVDDVLHLLSTSKRIVVMTGAGVSTASGIPDFRSAGTGLYDTIRRSNLPALSYVADPQQLFDFNIFREEPQVFYSVAKLLYKHFGATSPSLAHKFIAAMDRQVQLLRNFTQNVDSLESSAGISSGRVINCHGSLATATCMTCKRSVSAASIMPSIKAGTVARCGDPGCGRRTKMRRTAATEAAAGVSAASQSEPIALASISLDARNSATANPVNANASDHSAAATSASGVAEGGVMKPDAIFFHEPLPKAFDDAWARDPLEADVLIVIGSSLKVKPASDLPKRILPTTPAILINREPVGYPDKFDVELLGDADVICEYLWRRLGWPGLHDAIKSQQQVQLTSAAASSDTSSTAASTESSAAASSSAGGADVSVSFEPPNRYRFESTRATAACSAADVDVDDEAGPSSSEYQQAITFTSRSGRHVKMKRSFKEMDG